MSILTLLVIDCILNCLVILLLGYLIGIHAVLRCKGMTTYEYIKTMRKKKENKVKPTAVEEKKSLEIKNNNKEVKKSILKGANKTALDNPFSFSIAKSASEEIMHLTFQIRIDTHENDDMKII